MGWRQQGLRTGDGHKVGLLPQQGMQRAELEQWDWSRGGSNVELVEVDVRVKIVRPD